ncbi:MAG: hypothetical protein ACLSVX_12675 [Massilimicrobiota timonensis]
MVKELLATLLKEMIFIKFAEKERQFISSRVYELGFLTKDN